MEIFKECVKNAAQKRIAEGIYFKDENKETECNDCGKVVQAHPAKCWGTEVPGYYQFNWHNHQKNLPAITPLHETGLSTEVRKIAEYVVMVYGRPCFITELEKESYTSGIMQGARIVEIRGYTFDRLYPMIPYSEWKEDEERKNRFTDALHAINENGLPKEI